MTANLRGKRPRYRHPQMVNCARLSQAELEFGRRLFPIVADTGKPKTRGECENVQRPCPYWSCSMHLATEVTAVGNIRFPFPDTEPEDLIPSCAMDIADDGPHTLKEVGAAMGLTRERTRQIQVVALQKILRREPDIFETLTEMSDDSY